MLVEVTGLVLAPDRHMAGSLSFRKPLLQSDFLIQDLIFAIPSKIANGLFS